MASESSEIADGNHLSFRKIKDFISNFFLIFFSISIIFGVIVLLFIALGIERWVFLYNWEINRYLDTPVYTLIFLIALIVLIPLSIYGSIYAVKFIAKKIQKDRKYKTPRAPRITTIASVIGLIGVIIFFPDFSLEISQYKKWNRDQITVLAKGHPDIVLSMSNAYLKEYPEDLEARYLKAIAYSLKGDLSSAQDAVEDAVNNGLSFERFLAGPRTLLGNLYSYYEFQSYSTAQNKKLIQGPVLGNITAHNASFWVRTALETPVSIRIANNSDMVNAIVSDEYMTKSEQDYTTIITIGELNKSTEYFYEVIVDGVTASLDNDPSFYTYPEVGDSGSFKVGFGGGAGFTPEHEYMWNTILSHYPDAFLLLGDNVYIDTPETPETQRYCYYRRQCRDEYRNFSSSTPIYAIWDDHDFGDNDCTSSLSLDEPNWKLDVLEIFKQNFVNPFYSNSTEHPGVWFNFTIGDVDFFMLDCRFYRQNPKEFNTPSMLGPYQKQWLLDSLNKSDASYKVIASSVPWAYNTKPGSLDTWDGFPKEREDLFSFIEDEEIEGVILLSADRHRSDAWLIERENGYDFYDFESSKLTNIHTHSVLDGSIYGYNEKCSFGLLSFNTTKADPEVTYSIINIDNELQWSLTLKKSDLSFI
ncbi:MAG: hypothetical protein GF364_22550 [Candidatus Lokiarchaeota archaeon]|nr:hypothetical protein [Candidatus Lokiarchaeota archaeon]